MLKVWLPLNGTLENKGCSGIVPTASNPSYTNGKIGQCYNGGDLTIATGYTFGKVWSFAFWGYVVGSQITSNWTLIARLNDGGTNLRIEVCPSSYSNGIYCYSTHNNSSYNITTGGVNSPTGGYYDQWAHFCLTSDGITITKYMNGNKIGTCSYNGSGQINGTFVLANNSKIYKNDVRIYDHCLSAAEVKEISQGLVLHYKLDSFQGGLGNPNLYTGSRDFSGSWGNGNNWTTATETYKGFTVKQRSATWGGLHQNITCTQNDIFTISFYAKVESGGTIKTIHRSNLGNVTTGLSIIGGNIKSGEDWIRTSDDGTQWGYYWATVKIVSADITYLQWRLENSVNGKNMCICGIKLEKGSSATGWSPAASEGSFNTIQDSSGYGHNGTILNTITLSSDTPRYSASTNLTAGNSMINCGRGAMVTDSLTVNLWIKYSTWGNPISCTEGGGWNFENSSGIQFPVYIASVGYKVANAGALPSANTWHMITGTYNRLEQTVNIYIDGEFKKSTATGSSNLIGYHGSNVIWIGAEATGSNTTASNGMIGLVSDVRIYCTALSADDIKQLYQVSAKIDNLQGLHTFEIKETNRNLLAGRLWSNGYSQHNPTAGLFTNFNSKGEYQFTANGASAGSEYIPINPTGHTYEYDYTISVNTGNQFYIGFERYDANKTARSNNACVYTYATKPSSDVVKQHFTGTVNLSTDGTNPCAFIALRILNGWSGTTSGVTGTATIHSFSLREIGTKQNPKLTKQGQFIEEELKEETKMKLHKNGIVETNILIEK